MLENRRDRHDKEPAEEAQRGYGAQYLTKGEPRMPEESREDADAQGAQRHEAVFDLAARQIARDKAAEADTNRQRRQEVSRADLADPEHVLPVINHALLQQLPDEPEVSVAEARQPQHPVPAHDLHLLPKVTQEVGAKLLLRIGGRQLRNAEAEGEPDYR